MRPWTSLPTCTSMGKSVCSVLPRRGRLPLGPAPFCSDDATSRPVGTTCKFEGEGKPGSWVGGQQARSRVPDRGWQVREDKVGVVSSQPVPLAGLKRHHAY